MNSYNKGNCAKNAWHTFTNNFVASINGTQTLVFSYTAIGNGAVLYFTNVQVYDASNTQLLSNGDFSSSSGTTPTNWLECSSSGQVSSACSVNVAVACYTNSVQGGSISQSFPVTFGTSYTVAFDLYHFSPTGNSGSMTFDIAVA